MRSVRSIRVGLRRPRFRFRDFLVMMWLAKAFLLASFPLPVVVNRLDAAFFVLSLGILGTYFGTMSMDMSLPSTLGSTSTTPMSSIRLITS